MMPLCPRRPRAKPPWAVPTKWIRGPADVLAVEQGCRFDEAAGERVCRFIETFCRQSKGKWGGEPLTLLDWQRDFLMRLFGWKRPDGTRRYRRAYLEVAKKNGKSTLLSAIALYLLLGDGERGPEVYLNACDREQASIIFLEASRMIRSSPDLCRRLDVIDSKKRIVHPAGNGFIRANSADVASKDGVNAHGIIFDEVHRLRGRELWQVFEYAGESREQPLWLSITTAGEDEEGVWFEQREYSEAVNRGDIPDTSHLGVVYRALPTDELDDPATWLKANPSLGFTLKYEDFKAKLDAARQNPVEWNNFLRLKLNIIARASAKYFDADAWAECQGLERRELHDLRGGLCHAGGDLSSTTDLTAMAAVFGDDAGGFDVHAWFWVPEDNVAELERRDKQPYSHWIDEGWITATPGNVVDYEFIRSEVNALAADHDLLKLGLDPWNATKLGQDMQNDGLNVEFVRQGYQTLNYPTKELRKLILSGKVRPGENPVLKWCVMNAIVTTDPAGNVKLDKKKSRQKIDGCAALVNALAVALGAEPAAESVYNEREMYSF
jgi:phage terminase large subunit-like protein